MVSKPAQSQRIVYELQQRNPDAVDTLRYNNDNLTASRQQHQREVYHETATPQREVYRETTPTPTSGYYEQQKVMSAADREKNLLLIYLQTHPQVAASLGITIPAHMKQRISPAPNTRVELFEFIQPSYYDDIRQPQQVRLAKYCTF